MPRNTPRRQRSQRPLHSYILRIVEQRVLSVSVVYELVDIGDGSKRRFDSLEALQRHLGHIEPPPN